MDEIYVKPAAGDAGGALGRRAALDLDDVVTHYPTRFMLYITRALDDRVPAVTHVDGSSRPQPALGDESEILPTDRAIRRGERRAAREFIIYRQQR